MQEALLEIAPDGILFKLYSIKRINNILNFKSFRAVPIIKLKTNETKF